MVRWIVVSGPRGIAELADVDLAYGWAYDIERDNERRTVTVYLAGGLTVASVPEECRRAIHTDGRSAVEAVLDRARPPRYIALTSGGITERDE